MSFYDRFKLTKKDLEVLGHEVAAPQLEFGTTPEDTSVQGYLERGGGFDAFPRDHKFWKTKGKAMQTHFQKIENSEAVLIANYTKNGVTNYIGNNTFLELGYAFGRQKKIFILHNLPEISPFHQEILAMRPIDLGGNLSKIG